MPTLQNPREYPNLFGHDVTVEQKPSLCEGFCSTGGSEENRTPVRKPVRATFSECSLSIKSPLRERRQTGFRVWQPLVQQELQGYRLKSFTA